MKTDEIRQAFLSYFKEQNHTVIPTAPLVPENDPTLLFVNAGMVPFKNVFLGEDKRPYTRATSSQRCVRAGGKHNDLENVGFTARHHTFFEMLGNFSFGDYFKRDAIAFAWEFLTKTLGLPEEKLWVTVYKQDDETADIWLKERKIDPKRFTRCGEKDNFWSMGDTGPCGPCTEIFYDHGPEVAGGPPGTPEEDGDRYVEIWNLVFMQYNRTADGVLTPLPKPSVDTGLGLERIAAVMQNVHNNYDIDLFKVLITDICKVLETKESSHHSVRVVADHLRSCAFLVADGVVPSNEGRGYVLRRIMRRAIRHGRKLGATEPFFHLLIASLVKTMGGSYPELPKKQEHIEKVFLKEEEQFVRTLESGLKILEQSIASIKTKIIPGDIVFKLYDTYGFPVDLTADIARERNLHLDTEGFEAEMAKQRARARGASQFEMAEKAQLDIKCKSDFVGYESLEGQGKILGLYQDGQAVPELSKGMTGSVVLDKTPFYAQAGGQVGDSGVLRSDTIVFEVHDTQKISGAYLHTGSLNSGSLKVGQTIIAEVNPRTRQRTALNHSATHLLHAALRALFGEQLHQKGSLVDPERLRFDFSHTDPLTQQELQTIEDRVNAEIRHNHLVDTKVMSIDEAMNSGAMALFGEKYDDKVRVLTMGEDFSVELCGGTHAKRTGDIGLFKIVSGSGIASGVRRIEAVTGEKALEYVRDLENALNTRLEQVLQRSKQLEKEVVQLKTKVALGGSNGGSPGDDLLGSAKKIGDMSVISAKLAVSDAKILRDISDRLKNKLGSGVVVLAGEKEGAVLLIASVTKDLVKQVHAGKLVNYVANQVGGKGGGRPDMAQAGGSKVEHLDDALSSVYSWVEKQLS